LQCLRRRGSELLHDRDAAFTDVVSTIRAMQIREVVTAPRSPWQNAYVERLIGSIRRECLDHVIVLSVDGLQRVLADYVAYYMNTRTHLSLGKDAPASRPVTPLSAGRIVEIPQVHGLHHHYDPPAAPIKGPVTVLMRQLPDGWSVRKVDAAGDARVELKPSAAAPRQPVISPLIRAEHQIDFSVGTGQINARSVRVCSTIAISHPQGKCGISRLVRDARGDRVTSKSPATARSSPEPTNQNAMPKPIPSTVDGLSGS
jgi:hypothetical protein